MSSAAPERTPSPSGALFANPATEPGVTQADGEAVAGASPAPGAARPPRANVPGYEVLGELGRGGMGVVYKARHLKLGRLVALKMILAGPHAGPELLHRFQTEAEAIARLAHPNVIQVYEVGEHDGHHFLALEFCPGGSLAQRLAHTPLPPREAARLLADLAWAIHAAHQAGVIHRDLKPANVLFQSAVPVANAEDLPSARSPVSDRGLPKITDFGLAKKLGESGQTRSGDVLGTPSYMAPEQAVGRAREVGAAADVYALGAILYECLTGRPPFKAATSLETVLLVVREEPLPPRRLQPRTPLDLETICLKWLDKDPARRYASAEGLADDLDRFLRNEPITARPVGRLERGRRWCRRYPARAAAAALGLLLLAALIVGPAVFAWSQNRHAGRLAEEQGKTRTALDEARKSQREALRQAAASVLDRALALCEQGQSGRGLLWLARGLALARRADDASLEDAFHWELGAWAAETHALALALDYPGPVSAVAFSADGRIVAAGRHGRVLLWRADTGAPHGKPLAHPGAVHALAFLPGTHWLLTGCADGVARLWDGDRGALLEPPMTHYRAADRPARAWPFLNGVRSLAVSPDGGRAVTAGCDGTLRLWSLPDGRPLARAVASAAPVLAVAFAPDGRSVLSGGSEWRVSRWDAGSLKRIGPPRYVGSVAWGLAFTPDGRTALVGVQQGAALLRLHLAAGTQARPLKHLWTVAAVASTPDGRVLVSGGHDRVTRLWDAATGRPLGPPLPALGSVLSVAVSPDGRFVAVGSEDGAVRLWRLAPGALRRTLHHPPRARAVAFTPDGRFLLTGNSGANGCETARWDVATGRLVGPVLRHVIGQGHVSGVAVSPDGAFIYTADTQQQVVRRWEAATGKELGTTGRHGDEVWCLALSPDGRRLVTGSPDYKKPPLGCSARLWDAATGKAVGPPLVHGGIVQGVAFSPDSRVVLTGSRDRTTRLWDANTGEPLGPPRPHAAEVGAVAFHPDGKTILVGRGDGNAQRWELATWRPVGPPLVHDGGVTSVGYTRDGRLIVTTSSDGTARLWHPQTGKQVGPSLTHGGAVYQAACAPDGTLLATCSDDGTARLWALPGRALDEPAEAARRAALLTGLSLDDSGTVGILDPAAWRAARAESAGGRLTTDRGPAPPDAPPRHATR